MHRQVDRGPIPRVIFQLEKAVFLILFSALLRLWHPALEEQGAFLAAHEWECANSQMPCRIVIYICRQRRDPYDL